MDVDCDWLLPSDVDTDVDLDSLLLGDVDTDVDLDSPLLGDVDKDDAVAFEFGTISLLGKELIWVVDD